MSPEAIAPGQTGEADVGGAGVAARPLLETTQTQVGPVSYCVVEVTWGTLGAIERWLVQYVLYV